jgi:hypothetical protein
VSKQAKEVFATELLVVPLLLVAIVLTNGNTLLYSLEWVSLWAALSAGALIVWKNATR